MFMESWYAIITTIIQPDNRIASSFWLPFTLLFSSKKFISMTTTVRTKQMHRTLDSYNTVVGIRLRTNNYNNLFEFLSHHTMRIDNVHYTQTRCNHNPYLRNKPKWMCHHLHIIPDMRQKKWMEEWRQPGSRYTKMIKHFYGRTVPVHPSIKYLQESVDTEKYTHLSNGVHLCGDQ